MKDEIREGVEFLRQFLAKYGQLSQTQIDLFATKLTQLLEKRYVNHWYDAYPMKGQAFRCLRVKRSENYLDPVLDQILKELSLTISQLGLPNDFTLWIDPGEVNVRFGDQAGYTYSIARVNKSPSSSIQEEAKPSQEENGASKPKSLIVENSAKIFDEKLTAFIRQNSCNNPIPAAQRPAQAASELDEDDFDKDISSADLIENLIKLSAEKRTISPPTSSLNNSNAKNPSAKRTNSSNININSSQLNEFIPSNNNNNNNNNSAQNNRLSYNDSCYYSSSSSSCSSSFGSNHDENLAQLGWLQQQQEQTSSLLSRPNQCMPSVNTQSLFDNSNFSLDNANIQSDFLFMPSFYTNNNNNGSDLLRQNSDTFGFYNQNQFGAFGSAKSADFDPASFDSFNNNVFASANSFGMNPNFMANLNSLNATNSGFLGGECYKMGGSVYSETSSSSERSDTPSSCVTTASSLSCFTPGKSEPVPAAKQEEREFNPASSSSSSSSSSTSTVSDSNVESKANSASNLNEISTTPTKEKQSGEEKQAAALKLSKSPSDTRKADSKSPSSDKKEDSYCGYVESFPYYYKLNRLYNALAVQKMQTERLKKTPVMNVSPSVNSPASIAAAFANLATSSTATSIGQAQLRNLSKQPGSSPSNKFAMGSPSSSPSAHQMSTLSASTSPPPLSKQQQQQLGLQRSITPLSLKLSPSAVNHPNVIGSPSKNFQFNQQQASMSNSPSGLRQNANSPNGKNQNGYPMSPVNAAISFANHQTRANASKTSSFQQRQNQQQPYKSNINSLPASFNGNMGQNNSSKLFDASLANLNSIGNNGNVNNNNSFFPMFQQQQQAQQQQQQQQSPQSQQQQIYNNFYSKQMNWNRGQDMLKS